MAMPSLASDGVGASGWLHFANLLCMHSANLICSAYYNVWEEPFFDVS